RVPMGEAAESALGAGYVLTEDNVDELVPMIRGALESDPLGLDRTRWRTYHFGEYGPGDSLATFEDALRDAIVERDRLIAAKRERLASGESRPRLPKAE
ncbi:MAG: hypothetical protein M3094_03225, partial [Actinomycetia bacterium]|nr:hypothetical protein [Actinomycetes bacterium]